jgi:hypothetical protein
VVHSEADAAYERALHGDFVGLPSARDALTNDGPGLARRLALDALHRLVAPEAASILDVRRLSEALATETTAAWAARALAHGAVEAVLAFDGRRLAALEAATSAITTPDAEGAVALLRGWSRLARGAAQDAVVAAEAASAHAKRTEDASLRVDAATLRALSFLELGRGAEATDVARRASRMARTEQLLVQEYLANLALARVRRYAGRAHLAARIASALDQVAPLPWRSWLRWELSMAGQRVASAGDETPGALLTGALDAAERGDVDAFVARAGQCGEAAAGFVFIQREANALFALADPHRPVDDPVEVAAFARGATPEPPFGVRDRNVGATTAALVLAAPGRAPRRVLRTGVPLLGDEAWTPPEGNQKDARTHTLIAVVALAGEAGIDEGEAFRAVYGFEMVPVKHDGVFRTLRHRAKATLGDGASLERVDGRLSLVPSLPLLCPDPRTQLPTAERILALLAAGHGRVTAKQIAETLSIAVRSAQAALGELVDEGACVAERVGRRVENGVEDTTFYEPSLHRLAARAP